MKKFNIAGFTSCGYFKKTVAAINGLSTIFPSKISLTVHEYATRDEFRSWLDNHKVKFGPSAASHTTSPFVWFEDGQYLGGSDDTLEWCRKYLTTPDEQMATSSATMAPTGNTAPWGPGQSNHGYDYDLVVIGGGSGGLACSQEAQKLGAKVAVLDFVKPSPQGSTWGLGGTCVNVGCIPKKLMHTAALLGESAEDALEYGWTNGTSINTDSSMTDSKDPSHAPHPFVHNWEVMKDKIQDHIKGINFSYRVKLREVGITYLKKLGKFVDKNTIECTDDKGKKQNITSAKVVIAVGGRPSPIPDCIGNEYCITSDDIFMKETPPLKTCVIGAGYVALECAGFLTNLKQGEIVVLVRSMLLRGFDRDTVERVKAVMEAQGTRILENIKPEKIEKLSNGRFLVHYSNGENEEFDTVLSAVGRQADTSKLGLENVGIPTNSKSGKIVCTDEQTVTSNIYAVGDVVEGAPELTPSAILSGKLLARRLFKMVPVTPTDYMDYQNVATAVFTPLELGTVGLSEEAAVEKYGQENIDCYVSEFVPLEWSILAKQDKMKCFAKIVVKKDSDKVLGFHIACPHAGEIMQGFGVAIKQGITHQELLNTVGIHPTVAEEFTLLHTSKSSGVNFKKTSC